MKRKKGRMKRGMAARRRWRDCTAGVMDGGMKGGGKEGEKDGREGDKHDN